MNEQEANLACTRTPRMAPQQWGFDDAELTSRPTVYREDLFQGKVFLVSGGGGGIGRATVFLLTRLGAQIMICGRNGERLKATVDAVARNLGREVACKAMTIRDPAQVDEVVAETFERFGRLDVLVNNAGGQFAQNALDFSPKGWNAVIDTNLNGTWYMMQAAARRWSDRGEAGNIVNIVTTVERGIPQQAHTCAARAGVIYLSRSVAVEWAPHSIRVNCLAPGTIATAGLNNYPPELLTRLGKANPLRAMGDVWDIAEGIVYLAGPSGKFVTGELLYVNGGAHLWGTNWPMGVPEHYQVY